VLELNRATLGRLGSEASLEIVPGAGHLFEEPGTLEQVAELAVGWFTRWLAI
jgi:putative phosphoribosyl transferase